MAPVAQDAFLWDVDQVVHTLCAEGVAWTRDRNQLEAKIREEEIDGRTLLTFEQICSNQELMDCLGVRLARHKAALCEKLLNLRAVSPKYRAWHRDITKKKALELEDTTAPEAGEQLPSINPPGTNGSHPNQDASLEQAQQTSSAGLPNGRSKNLDDSWVGDAALQSLAGADGGSGIVQHQPQDPLPSRPYKRRRIEPETIATFSEDNPKPEKRLPWEFQPSRHGKDFAWDNPSPWAYIGDGKLETKSILAPHGVLSQHFQELNETDFASVVQNRLPPGRRLIVNRVMKSWMMRKSRTEYLQKRGEVPMRSPSAEDEDKILDLSDLASEWDEETKREIEEERRELEKWKQRQHYVPYDRVQTILDEEIERMTDKWRSRRLHKQDQEAYRIWNKARRNGTKVMDIISARQRANALVQRMQKMRGRILDEKYKSENAVRAQAEILDQTVSDKNYNLWVMDVLESKAEPPKPETKPRQPQPRKKRSIDPENELLVSSDEEGFVVENEEDVKSFDPARDSRSLFVTPVQTDAFAYIDLTQSGPHDERQLHNNSSIIDLTLTPTKSNGDIIMDIGSSPVKPTNKKPDAATGGLMPPLIEHLETMQEICSVDKKHWSSKNDRWRLVIYMLGKLTFGRRADILARLKANSNDKVWETAILTFTSQEKAVLAEIEQSETETTNYDISRLFLSFVKCKIQGDKRMLPLHPRSKKKILDRRDTMFGPFCDFVRAAEPIFPQANQIFRTDDIDALPDDDEADEEEEEAEASQRRAAPREIIRNRDAAELREREQKRVKDQEARRLRLRATLASSGTVSQDKSRLIINESKEDEQSLLYVNDDIGKSIKDYQVDGVRFLWNQIILDTDMRQGCLLAHTMGLGKTMQVITFLVGIAEARESPDPLLRTQVPEDLSMNQVLILCPAGLVNNWIDELLKWAPSGALGQLSQLDSTAKTDERVPILEKWAKSGGVLVIGYNMFKRIADDEDTEKLLLETPNIVVADEAHTLKNPDSKINRLCSQFKTTRRIALTGSPLANNVEEYYSTISWVAPNFLGPLAEFREVYVRDIEAGLAGDSVAWERRKALKMLQVLKDTVAPKVNRATIKSCLAFDLPPKMEFVISLPPTDIQKKLYELYINGLQGEAAGTITAGTNAPKLRGTQIFGIINDLASICNHPRCFLQKVNDVREHPEKHVNFPRDIIPSVLSESKRSNIGEPSLSLKVQYLIKILDEARSIGDKVLVFSQSIHTLDYLESLFGIQKRAACRLDGSTKIDERQDKIRNFNVGNKEVYLISTTAGGVGLNIQGANRVVIFDSKWNPVNDQQAVGRSYRLGQTKKVYVYHLMVAGTYEEALQSQAVFKTQLASRVVDKKNPIAWGKRHAKLTQQISSTESEDLTGFIGKDDILDKLIQNPPGDIGHIKRIVSTDTFEEEDINTNLTAEERREAEGLVELNRLRRTDPVEYERRKTQQIYVPDPSDLPLPAISTNTSTVVYRSTEQAAAKPAIPVPTPAVTPTGDDTQETAADTKPTEQADAHESLPPQPSPKANISLPRTPNDHKVAKPLPQFPAPPMPMAGANTFFGQPRRTATPPNQMLPTATPADRTPIVVEDVRSPGGSLFGQAQSPEKKKFQEKMARVAASMKSYGISGVEGHPDSLAAKVTQAVHQVRQEKQLGFLPDNQQWRNLVEMLDQERFVLGALSGFLTAKFLANADKSSLQQRVTTLNGLSESDFQRRLRQPSEARDPENLQNIRRPQTSVSPLKRNDVKVMREAADNRKHRKPWGLPEWAVEGLRRGSSHDTGTPQTPVRHSQGP